MPCRAFTTFERATLTSLQETFAPDCDTASCVRAIEELLVRLPDDQLARFRMLLRLLDSPALGLWLAGRPRAFSRLDARDRERVLLAMSDNRFAVLRTAFQSLKRPCTFMAYAAVDERGRNPLWPAVGYPGPRSDDGHAPMPAFVEELGELRPARNEIRLSADVVVVGSGAGGGVAAAVFASAGRRVIVLEAGPRTDNVAFNQREADAMRTLYLDSSLVATDDLGVAVAAGSCVGGGTVINLCSSLPLRPQVAAQWQEASGGIDFERSLHPHVDAVRTRLHIAASDRRNAQNDALERGCRAMGWHVAEMERNANGCGDGCGYCGFGCAYGCKQSTTATYLRDAASYGARVFAGVRVIRANIDCGRAVGVDAVASVGAGGSVRLRVDAPTVVLAAGALRTPGILAHSGIRNKHLGRHLHLHPSTALVAEFKEPIESWVGPAQTTYCDEFSDIEDGYGVMFETQPTHPGLAASGFPWRAARAHAASLRNIRHAAVMGILARDRDWGRVDLDDGRPRYRLSAFDARHLLKGLATIAEAALAAGAQRISTLHTRPVTLSADRADARGRAAFADAVYASGAAPNRLTLFSAHQMGTCRMHRDPRQGVVDERGAVHGVRGIIVADSSVFPLAAGVNPMLPIMAVAHRTASIHARP